MHTGVHTRVVRWSGMRPPSQPAGHDAAAAAPGATLERAAPGVADRLRGSDRIVLSVRPGITGPTTLADRDEETLLSAQAGPDRYDREVVYPDKVRINRAYVEAYAFWRDLVSLWRTVVR